MNNIEKYECSCCKEIKNITEFNPHNKLFICKKCSEDKKELKLKSQKRCFKCDLIKSLKSFFGGNKCKLCHFEEARINRNTEIKKCKICKENKLICEFPRHLNQCYRPLCQKCYENFYSEKQKNHHKNMFEKRKIRNKNKNRINIEHYLIKGAKGRAKKNNLPFNLKDGNIIIPKYCPILGIEIKQGIGKTIDSSPSIDRIIPEKGYIKENCKVISWRANSIKRDSTIEELQKIINYIKDNLPPEDYSI